MQTSTRGAVLVQASLLTVLGSLSGCVRAHDDTGFALTQLEAIDYQATARPAGVAALVPGRSDPLSVHGLSRAKWGVQRETYSIGQVETDPAYLVNHTLTDSQARQIGDYPSLDSALQTPNDDDRLISLAEGFAVPALALADGALLVPRLLMKPPGVSSQWSGLQTGKQPRPQVSIAPSRLGVRVPEAPGTEPLPPAGSPL